MTDPHRDDPMEAYARRLIEDKAAHLAELAVPAADRGTTPDELAALAPVDLSYDEIRRIAAGEPDADPEPPPDATGADDAARIAAHDGSAPALRPLSDARRRAQDPETTDHVRRVLDRILGDDAGER
ncbi:hypothetical protein [Streptodolium elevatio]|uniref:Uncharacterized protein n=1 Tax=Streptodolium elevatio TaxID=3157996 RepID=A0ABV3DHR0_9ACTN